MRGWILLNGNIDSEADLILRFKDRILVSNHLDPAVRASQKVVMITAAWRKDEHNESHVRHALNGIGIPSRYEDGFDVNVQNLSIYHEFNTFKLKEPELHRQYHAKQDTIKDIKQFYRRKNTQLVALLKDQNALIKRSFPGTTLAEVLAHDVAATRAVLRSLDLRRLQFHYCCEDIQHTMQSIIENDEKMVQICNEVDDHFFSRSGVTLNATYREMKRRMEDRILTASSLFIFGGFVAVLYNRLNFFKLRDALVEALRRGTNFYTVSAGGGVLCRSIILYDDFAEGKHHARDFEFFDTGFGIIDKVQLFPHCQDRIKTDDADNLAYLAHRFRSSSCVGLNQESFLLMEEAVDATGARQERYVSVGDKDGVYVFDRAGNKVIKAKGEELEVRP